LLKSGDVLEENTQMIEMQNGCICCTLRHSFMAQIEQLSKDGRVRKIIVEASGVSSPAAIGLAFQDYEESHKHTNVFLDSIVTVVDADRIYTEFLGELQDAVQAQDADTDEDQDPNIINLVMDQIEFCNIIVLNKCDLLPPQKIEEVRLSLRALQREAEIVETIHCKINPNHIFGHRFSYDKVLNSSMMERTLAHARKHEEENEEEDEYGISSFVYEERHPFDRDSFSAFVAQDYPEEIIRAKGYLWFADDHMHTQLFEQAGRNASINEVSNWVAALPQEDQNFIFQNYPETKDSWDEAYGDRLNQIVFIGKGYNRAEIERMLDDCLAKTE